MIEKEARDLLGDKYKSLSSEELQEIISYFSVVSKILINSAFDVGKQQNQ